MSKIRFQGESVLVELPTKEDVVTQANIDILKNVDVTGATLVDGDILVYNLSEGNWKNSLSVIDGGTY